jgi:MFS family permease
MAVVGKLGFFVLLIFVYGAYYGLTEGAERAMVADFVPSDRRGKAYGLYHGAVGLAALPASLLFGFLWSRFGPQLSFTIGAILAGIATLLFLVFIANCSNQSK